MGELTVGLGQQLQKLKQGGNDVSGIQKPFQQEIFLLNCNLAGAEYYDPETTHKGIKTDAEVFLQREAWNKYDTFAIAVLDGENRKIGYIPRNDNKVFARLLDAGKFLTAYVNENKYNNGTLKVSLRLMFKEI